jgi:hypothetical protein
MQKNLSNEQAIFISPVFHDDSSFSTRARAQQNMSSLKKNG